jgi:hypothetical protein
LVIVIFNVELDWLKFTSVTVTLALTWRAVVKGAEVGVGVGGGVAGGVDVGVGVGEGEGVGVGVGVGVGCGAFSVIANVLPGPSEPKTMPLGLTVNMLV